MSDALFPMRFLLGHCEARTCPERMRAMQVGEFVYSHDAPVGWIFVEHGVREWIGNARWTAGVYGTADHTGEPFTWSCCPFCGRELEG